MKVLIYQGAILGLFLSVTIPAIADVVTPEGFVVYTPSVRNPSIRAAQRRCEEDCGGYCTALWPAPWSNDTIESEPTEPWGYICSSEFGGR